MNLSDDQVFAVVLVALVALLGILIIMAAARASAEKKRKTGGTAPVKKAPEAEKKPEPAKEPVKKAPEPEKKPKLMGSMARKDTPVTPAGGDPVRREGESDRDKKSIDERIAEKNGQWVCRYCESINDHTLTICQACGNPR